MVRLSWEKVTTEHRDELFRAKVPGGWLVKVMNIAKPPERRSTPVFTATGTYLSKSPSILEELPIKMDVFAHPGEFDSAVTSSITFVPDPTHSWK